MYGLIVKLTAAPNSRDDLITMLGGDDSHTIPGCLSFIVAEDTTDPDILWVTEVWESHAAHEASLAAPLQTTASKTPAPSSSATRKSPPPPRSNSPATRSTVNPDSRHKPSMHLQC
jgi:quinol monooxygenase YgiN